jgi:hypothetical protein
MLNKISAQLDKLSELRREIEGQLREFIVDESVDLDTRWDEFIKSGLGETDRWIQDFRYWIPKFGSHETASQPTAIIDVLHDTYDRHQTIEVQDLYYRLGYWVDDKETFEIDKYQYKPEFKPLGKVKVQFTQEDADMFREDCLQRFLKAFKWDW